MSRGELTLILLTLLKGVDLIASAAVTSVNGDEIGIEMQDGSEFFIVVEEA